MRLPKRYGMSRIEMCPFCDRHATSQNPQGIPVCVSHKGETLDNLKCVCGRDLFAQKGKFGTFFICTNCGNLTLRKVLEINSVVKSGGALKTQSSYKQASPAPASSSSSSAPVSPASSSIHSASSSRDAGEKTGRKSGPREITIRSDELDF